MFIYSQASWNGDTCRMSDNLSVRVRNSLPTENTYQIFLLWQDNPGEERRVIYRRYIKAKDLWQARQTSFRAIRSWLKKNREVPDFMYLETYNDALDLFGIEPLEAYRPPEPEPAPEPAKKPGQVQVRVFIENGTVKTVMSNGVPANVEVIYGEKKTGNITFQEARDRARRKGLTKIPFKARYVRRNSETKTANRRNKP